MCLGCCSPRALAAEPTLEWRYETGGKVYAPPVVADLDSDGHNEVIVVASRDKRVLCLDGAGMLLWEHRFDDDHLDGIQAAPSVVDLDGDGRQEVFVITKAGLMACLDHTGAIVWRCYLGDEVDYSGPVLADVNGDERIDIVVGSESGTVYCHNNTGAKQWHYQDRGAVRGVPAVARQADADSLRVYAAFGDGAQVCLDSEGTVVWRYDEPGQRKEQRSGPAVGDLDGDGRLEVCFATEDCTVIARDAETGEERWRWKAVYAVDQTHSFALAAFDRPHGLDVVFGDGLGLSQPGNLYRVRDGKVLWTADMGGGIVQGPAIGDIDGDGQLEVLACSRSSRLVCLSADGQLEWDFPTDAGALATPTLADVDNDGVVEILFTSKDRSVYCVSVGGAYAADRLPWPRLGKNNQLTNYAGDLPAIALSEPHGALTGPTLAFDDWSEHPAMGSNTAWIRVQNPYPRAARLELQMTVSPPAGPKTLQTVVRTYEPGESKSFPIDYEILYPGDYEVSATVFSLNLETPIAQESRTHAQKLFERERKEEKKLSKRIRAFRKKRPSASYAAAAQGALQNLEPAPETYGLDVSQDEARERVAAMHQRLEGLHRIAERLEAAIGFKNDDPAFAVIPASTMRKVYRDEVFDHDGVQPAEISLARNEYEGVQLVVLPLWHELRNLSVTVSPLRLKGGTSAIHSKDIEVTRVGYVTAGPPEYNVSIQKVGGDHPDVLFPLDPYTVPADADAQPYFVTVRTRMDTKPGVYEGSVVFETEGLPAVTVPLNVRVRNFTLPDHTHLKISFWYHEGFVQHYYGYQNGVPEEVRNRFIGFHLKHRVGPMQVFQESNIDALQYAMSRGQNTLFYQLPAYIAPKRREAFAATLREARARIQELGWDESMLFYTRDEVAVLGRHEIPRVVEFAEWVGQTMPEWPRLQTSAPEEQLLGMADIWCPLVDKFDPHVLGDRLDRGERLWFYTVWGRPGIMLEFPGTDTRLLFWQCWKYGAEGFMYWSTTNWIYNMQGQERWPAIPWIPWNQQPGHNGDGYLIYPGPDGTPYASIRLALVRDGIEDYEYLYLLRELFTEHAADLEPALSQRIAEMLDVDPRVFASPTSFTEDPAVLDAARQEIGDLIEVLQQRPH